MSNRRDAEVVIIAANLKARQQGRPPSKEARQERHEDRPPSPAYAVLLLAFGCLLAGCYYLIAISADTIAARLVARLHQSAQAAGRLSSQSTQSDITNAKFLPGYRPDSIWLVEKKENYELYSNGGRINTAYEVESHARAYYARLRGSANESGELRHDPVGIVFHTSESDIV